MKMNGFPCGSSCAQMFHCMFWHSKLHFFYFCLKRKLQIACRHSPVSPIIFITFLSRHIRSHAVRFRWLLASLSAFHFHNLLLCFVFSSLLKLCWIRITLVIIFFVWFLYIILLHNFQFAFVHLFIDKNIVSLSVFFIYFFVAAVCMCFEITLKTHACHCIEIGLIRWLIHQFALN